MQMLELPEGLLNSRIDDGIKMLLVVSRFSDKDKGFVSPERVESRSSRKVHFFHAPGGSWPQAKSRQRGIHSLHFTILLKTISIHCNDVCGQMLNIMQGDQYRCRHDGAHLVGGYPSVSPSFKSSKSMFKLPKKKGS